MLESTIRMSESAGGKQKDTKKGQRDWESANVGCNTKLLTNSKSARNT